MTEHFFDAAIILGARTRADNSPSPSLERRVAQGVRLVAQGQAGVFLASGGVVGGPVPEALVMRDMALAQGLAQHQILCEERSTNTLENALFAGALCRRKGWSRICVVTDSYHLPRALYAFRRLGVAAAPSPSSRLEARHIVPILREVAAFGLYLWRVEAMRKSLKPSNTQGDP